MLVTVNLPRKAWDQGRMVRKSRFDVPITPIFFSQKTRTIRQTHDGKTFYCSANWNCRTPLYPKESKAQTEKNMKISKNELRIEDQTPWFGARGECLMKANAR